MPGKPGGKAQGRRGGVKTRDNHEPGYYATIGAKGGRTKARNAALRAAAPFDADGNRTGEIPFLPDAEDDDDER